MKDENIGKGLVCFGLVCFVGFMAYQPLLVI